jgi:hypothetical protein
LAFLFNEIDSIKRQLKPAKTETAKKRKEIDLTTSSDEDEEYLVTSPNVFKSSKPKLAKISHLTSELVVSLNFDY